jgi:hypothetical protein
MSNGRFGRLRISLKNDTVCWHEDINTSSSSERDIFLFNVKDISIHSFILTKILLFNSPSVLIPAISVFTGKQDFTALIIAITVPLIADQYMGVFCAPAVRHYQVHLFEIALGDGALLPFFLEAAVVLAADIIAPF